MNKEQRQQMIQILKKHNYPQKEIDELLKLKEIIDTHKFLQEGQRVKLNIEVMKIHPDWNRKTQEYKNWVENHVDVIFTVQYDKKHEREPVLVCLKEDRSKRRWLFHESDLIIINN